MGANYTQADLDAAVAAETERCVAIVDAPVMYRGVKLNGGASDIDQVFRAAVTAIRARTAKAPEFPPQSGQAQNPGGSKTVGESTGREPSPAEAPRNTMVADIIAERDALRAETERLRQREQELLDQAKGAREQGLAWEKERDEAHADVQGLREALALVRNFLEGRVREAVNDALAKFGGGE